MRLVVEPSVLDAAARVELDLSARMAALDTAPVGRLVGAGAPDTVSAGLALEVAQRLSDELSALAAELGTHSAGLGLAADRYAATECSVAGGVGSRP